MKHLLIGLFALLLATLSIAEDDTPSSQLADLLGAGGGEHELHLGPRESSLSIL